MKTAALEEAPGIARGTALRLIFCYSCTRAGSQHIIVSCLRSCNAKKECLHQFDVLWQKVLMNKLVIVVVFVFTGCFQLQKTGKEIFFHNQTENSVLVIETSQADHFFQVYDTSLVNGRIFVSRQPNYIAEHSDWVYMFSDPDRKRLKNSRRTALHFWIVRSEHVPLPLTSILENKLYRSFSVKISELEANDIHHVFIFPDSIRYEQRYEYFSEYPTH